jgi:RNA polymerase sigma-70 factor (ECF subfamily)
MNSDETALLSLLKQGDQRAFQVIYEQYWRDLYKLAYRRLADAQLAEDVVQEVFYRLWDKRRQLEINNAGAYLHRAVRNEVFDRLTRSAAPSRFFELFETMLLETETPEDILRSKDLLALVAAYADTLPDKRKVIFLLHIESKLNTQEIADKLQVSRKTVQNQLNTALTGLRSHLRSWMLALLSGPF